MDPNFDLLRSALLREFTTRKKTNARYSIRAFGRYLGVDASTLSKVIGGSRTPSSEFSDTVVKKLGLPTTTVSPVRDGEVIYLSSREFQAISSWEHFAILDLVTLSTFESDVSWMSAKLGIPEVDVRLALERLQALGLLIDEGGRLRVSGRMFSNHPDQQTTEAKKEYQRQLLRKSLAAIDHCESSEKDITSITIAGDLKRLEQAREMIKNFRRELCAFMESGDRTDVLHLTIQLCPANTDPKGTP